MQTTLNKLSVEDAGEQKLTCYSLTSEMSMARGEQFLILKMLLIHLRPICVSLTRIKKHKAMVTGLVAATINLLLYSFMAE